MVLYYYKPNGFGPDEFYDYSNCLESIALIKTGKKASQNGWLIELKNFFGEKHLVAVYGDNKEVYFDIGGGPLNYSAGEIEIKFKKLLNFSSLMFFSQGKLLKKFSIYTPLSRFFTNDGMFPEDVEPIYGALKTLEDKVERQRLATKWSN